MEEENLVLRPKPNASYLLAVKHLLRRFDRAWSQHESTDVEGMLRQMLRPFDGGFILTSDKCMNLTNV